MLGIKKISVFVYWFSTSIILFLLAFAAITYHVINEEQTAFFTAFGYPEYLIYPLAYLKIVAIVVIVTHRYNDLRDMVYAAYFLNMLLALVGHINYGDFYGHALVGLIMLPLSYLLGNQVRGIPKRHFFGRWTQ